MNQQGLGDLGFEGSKFTWSNKIFRRGHIRERLDRGIENPNWTLFFPNTKIKHLPIYSSDHAPLLLDTSASKTFFHSFKFEEFWARDPNCFNIIKESWENTLIGSPSFILSQKLKDVRKALKSLNKLSFGHIQTSIKQINLLSIPGPV